ncbi:hypothetical protein [Glycomyces niveus]|uniref:Uncharacterized protein n=1 Tax=Glycomyces niveus TaxID=2820287 RepID=A0ABS3U5X8_9ACTN|nr:hypothetical protein [Glycomyces sp. NEAU-S30]MBO3733856.1 hypothetical protein [Glycomyces sp. NEAU-S30]
MLRKTRAAAALLALAALAACTDDGKGGGGDGASPEFEEPRLVDMVNESNRLLYELEVAENRIIQACLEEGGHTVHDQSWFDVPEPEKQDEVFGADDWGNWIPPVEEAEQYGLGIWSKIEEGLGTPEAEEYAAFKGYELEGLGEAEAGGAGLPDNGEFEALTPEQQYDWYVAYFGEAAASQEWGFLVGAEATDTGGGDDGEIDLGDDFAYVEPEPGGCRREMIDALYEGDLRQVQDPEGQEYRESTWEWRPVNPADDFAAIDAANLAYEEAIAGVKGELVQCLADKGHPGWEFDEEGSLPYVDYLYELYEGSSDVHDHPELPADAPTDFDGKKEFEIAFAVALAECGDETGYRESAEQAWGDSREAYYVSIETQVYAWQEEVRGILTTAQEVLEG